MNTKKRVRASLPWFGFALLGLAALLVALSIWGKRSLTKAQDALAKAGRPMSIDEILPAEIPDDENAALAYAAAAELLEDYATAEDDLFTRLAEAAGILLKDPENREALEEFRRLHQVDAAAQALAAIEEGTLKSGYRNELDFSKGAALELPHLQDLFRLSRILAATVLLQVADGDQPGAWETAVTALRLANALEAEPLLISQLFRTVSFRRAIETLRGLDFSTVPAAQLREVSSLLARFEDPAPYVSAIDSERLFGEQYFNASSIEIAQQVQAPGARVLMHVYRLVPPLSHLDRAAHVNALRGYADALTESWSPGDSSLDESMMGSFAFIHPITKMTTPAFGSIKERMISMIAEARVMRAGLAAMDYKDQHGTYPADLATLGRDDLIDPFNGEPLVYRPEAAGFIISSVGPDVFDDDSANVPESSDDISWHYLQNPKRPGQ